MDADTTLGPEGSTVRERLESEVEARFVEALPGLVAIVSTDGNVERVNPEFSRYLGRRRGDLASWKALEAVGPEDSLRVTPLLVESMRTGEPYEAEVRLRRHDGVYRWFHVFGSPLRGNDGRILRWCFLHTDVDDRKRTEEALQAAEREAQLIVESIPGIIAIFDDAGALKFVNRHGQHYFGRTIDDLRGWDVADLVHPDDLADVVAAFRKSLESGQPFDIVSRSLAANGDHPRRGC